MNATTMHSQLCPTCRTPAAPEVLWTVKDGPGWLAFYHCCGQWWAHTEGHDA